MKYDKEQMKQTIEKNFLELIATRTDTGSKEERNMGAYFENYIKKVPYLTEHPEYCGLFKIPNDHLDREVPWCMLKGEGNDTIVLMGHYDIVETKDYLNLEPLSLLPHELEKAFKEGKMILPDDAKAALDSDEWLFGRGVGDMKAGCAIELSLFEEYSKQKDFKGNIIVMLVPDEENLSAGMRGGMTLLKQLKDKYNLNYILMFNTEPATIGPNGETQVNDGSIGKILPVVFVKGKLAHVSRVYEGFNPVSLLSEIVARLECNPEFIDQYGDTTSTPPTWLYVKDSKDVYDVSLPMYATGCLSVLPLKKTPTEIMDRIKEICGEAFEKVLADMNVSYEKYLKLQDFKVEKLPWNVNVKFYSELFEEAKRDSGDTFLTAYAELMADIKQKFSNNEISTIDSANLIISTTLKYVNDMSPQVIIAIAPPYYPCVNNSMLDTKDSKNVSNIIQDVIKYASDNYNEEYYVKNFITGISDLSYAFIAGDETNLSYIADNMLMWKDVYYIPLDDIKECAMPVLNIGPKGDGFHQYTERVVKKDLYYNTPELVNFVIEKLLGN